MLQNPVSQELSVLLSNYYLDFKMDIDAWNCNKNYMDMLHNVNSKNY